jgi:hypothetical protein
MMKKDIEKLTNQAGLNHSDGTAEAREEGKPISTEPELKRPAENSFNGISNTKTNEHSETCEGPQKDNITSTSNQNYLSEDKEMSAYKLMIQRMMLNGLPKVTEWETFDGQGAYNHIDFIDWIDTIKADHDMPDGLITSRFNYLLKGTANTWYKQKRNEVGKQDWPF